VEIDGGEVAVMLESDREMEEMSVVGGGVLHVSASGAAADERQSFGSDSRHKVR
jgi:hypothetical protein